MRCESLCGSVASVCDVEPPRAPGEGAGGERGGRHLQVSVDHIARVNMGNAHQNLCSVEFCLRMHEHSTT